MSREIFVSLNGDDAGSGALDQPFATIEKALAEAVEGDIITLRGGEYAGGIEIDTPNITLRSFEGEKVIISAPNDNEDISQAVLFDTNSDGSTLEGIEVSGGYYYSVKVESLWEVPEEDKNAATHITIKDCILHDSGRDVIKVTPGADGVQILNNEIFNSGMRNGTNAEGIDVVNGDDVIIRGNYIHDIATTGLYVKGGGKNALIENNYIMNTGMSKEDTFYTAEGITIGFDTDSEWFDPDNTDYYGTFDAVVRNNIIVNTRGAGILSLGSHSPQIYNNTLYNVAYDPVNFDAGLYLGTLNTYFSDHTVETKNVDPMVKNNIVIIGEDPDERADYIGNYAFRIPARDGDSGVDGTLDIDNNIYYRLDGQLEGLFGVEYPDPDFAEWQDYWGIDANSMVGLPTLDENFHLVEGSIAINAGAAIDGAIKDFDDGERTDGQIDIGADEFEAGTIIPVPDDGGTGVEEPVPGDDPVDDPVDDPIDDPDSPVNDMPVGIGGNILDLYFDRFFDGAKKVVIKVDKEKMVAKKGNGKVIEKMELSEILAESGAEHIGGTAMRDIFKGSNQKDDVLFGFAGDDKMNGKKGNDVLVGGEGDDYLKGAKGDDVFIGGAGNDKIKLNKGADTVTILNENFGDDKVFHFRTKDKRNDSPDHIDISDLTWITLDTFADFVDIEAVRKKQTGVTILDENGQELGTLKLKGVKAENLDADDFIFAL